MEERNKIEAEYDAHIARYATEWTIKKRELRQSRAMEAHEVNQKYEDLIAGLTNEKEVKLGKHDHIMSSTSTNHRSIVPYSSEPTEPAESRSNSFPPNNDGEASLAVAKGMLAL